jgi:hypothetical protein
VEEGGSGWVPGCGGRNISGFDVSRSFSEISRVTKVFFEFGALGWVRFGVSDTIGPCISRFLDGGKISFTDLREMKQVRFVHPLMLIGKAREQ